MPAAPGFTLLTVFGYFFVQVGQGHGWNISTLPGAHCPSSLLRLDVPRLTGGRPRDSEDDSADVPGICGKRYITACIVLTLMFGIGWRAWQYRDSWPLDLRQVPHYKGADAGS